MKNRIIRLISILTITMLVLLGCHKKEVSNLNDNKSLKVVSTIFAPYDFTRQIVGDKAQVSMLLPPGMESHSYEPSPQDIIKIQNCDVFIYVGGESEEWVTNILEAVGNDKIKVIKLLDCVQLVEEEIVDGMEHDNHEDEDHEDADHEDDDADHEDTDHEDEDHDDHEHHEGVYDEHVWTSPLNAINIVKEITKALTSIDNENKEFFRSNASDYIKHLENLDQQFREVVSNAKRKEIIFGDRFPLRYFVDTYGLSYYAAFPGCSTETEPSAATVAFLINKIRDNQIPVIFHIELSSAKMADTISEATGAKKLVFHSCHNVAKKDFVNGVTYLELMLHNVDVLKEALN